MEKDKEEGQGKMRHKTYFYRGLFWVIGLALAYGIPASFAQTTDSIFKKYVGEVDTAPVKKTSVPAMHEQARYADKIPVIDLEKSLIEAEKAIAFLIEEHNRRVDMISMQETYIENLQAQKVENKFKELLSLADDCNARQIADLFTQRVYSGSSKQGNREYRYSIENLADVRLNNIREEDKWKNLERITNTETGSTAKYSYPYLAGRNIWHLGLRHYILGTYTIMLNNAKASQGVWKGHPFDPITLDCTDWNNEKKTPKDSSKYAICKTASSYRLLGSDNKLKKFNNMRGMLELVEYKYTTPAIPTASTEWEKYYDNIMKVTVPKGQSLQDNPAFISFWELSNKAAREYRKERWKVGYQFLMDAYHNEKFGPIPNRSDRLWPDQKKRYLSEVWENFKRYYVDHYQFAGLTQDLADLQLEFNEDEDFDYYKFIPGGEWYNKVRNFVSQWQHANQIQSRWVCCEICDCDEPPCCCCDWALVYTPTPDGFGGEAPRVGSCTNPLSGPYDLHDQIQVMPRPLIWNNGSPSVMESVYIDADTDGKGGYKNVYDLSPMTGEFPLLRNGSTDGVYEAVPNPWRNLMSGGVGEKFDAYATYVGSTYDKSKVPPRTNDATYRYRTSACTTYNRWTSTEVTHSLGGWAYPSGERAEPTDFSAADMTAQLPQIFRLGNLPMNQNRIQVYLDIYEAYVHAVDANTHAKNENKKLQESLNKLLSDLAVNYANKIYEVRGLQPTFRTRSGSLSNAASMDKLYGESLERANVFYDNARDIAREITKAVIQSEEEAGEATSWRDAYEKWKLGEKIKLPDFPGFEGRGPTVTGGDSPKDVFLQRLARIYQTLFYFGGGEDIAGASVTYKPSVSKVNKALSGTYDASTFGDSRTKIERLKIDNSFKTPRKEENYGWTGDTTRTFNPQFKGTEFPEPEEEHAHIGVWAELTGKIRGKPIGTLEEGDVDDIIEEIDIARQERFDAFSKLNESKGEWATRLPKALSGNDSSVDHFFTKFNFDTGTCLLKKRSNSSR